MLRTPPELSPTEIRDLMRRWLDDLEGIELLRRSMPAGTTLEEALAFYRRLNQSDRRPSRVMTEDAES
jgi:hypothetical protein